MIMKKKSEMKRWTMDFVEFQMMKNILYEYHKRNSSIVQELLMRFWFFEIEKKNNHIKSLFYSKIWTLESNQRSIFFNMVEISLN